MGVLCGRFGGTVGCGSPPELAVIVGLGVPSLGGTRGCRWVPASKPGGGQEKSPAQLMAQPHGAEVPSSVLLQGGSLPALGLCWASRDLWGKRVHRRIPLSCVWGVGWMVPDIPQP